MSKDILSDVVVHNKYAKYTGGRRETWAEICTRSAQMFVKKYPDLEAEIYSAFGSYVMDKKVVPSMRCLQFAGKPIELAPNRLFNCSFMNMNHYRAFPETMFMLLGGSGVGFSVQRRHIDALPVVRPPLSEARYVVQDSITGWADAIKTLIKAYYGMGPRPVFDLSDIRNKGELLVTSGGKAPGPAPLKTCLDAIEVILSRHSYGDKLASLEVFDIQCHIAQAVLSGGVRRSATICLFDPDDESMLTAKYGQWWIDNPQRAMANISAVIDMNKKEQKETFYKIFSILKDSGSGEPGFIFSNDLDMGFNPCVEASLPDMGLCNLTSVNVGDNPSTSELERRVKVASFIGTLQAGFTDFFYLRPEWKTNAERDPLLGVSLTGLSSMDVYEQSWEHLADCVKKENAKWSEVIGIPLALRTTCVKPEGTSSLVMGTSSGVHAWYAPFYKRRIQLNKTEAITKYLHESIPELIEPHYLFDTVDVLTVPVKAPDGALMRTESARDTLERVLYLNETWVSEGHRQGANKHNVSCTVNVRPHEWDDLMVEIWNQRHNISGLSLLPYDNGTYKQAPFEEITEEEFNVLSEFIKDIDLTQVIEAEDMTDLSGEVACGGGGCEVK